MNGEVNGELAFRLRQKQPDATDREVELFEFLWTAWPYLPANLTNIATGERTAKLMNDWLERTYGLRFGELYKPKMAKTRTGTGGST